MFARVFSITIQDMLVYRINFVLWRFRNVVTLLIKYFLWTAVYASTSSLFGYTKEQMITYVLLSSVISSFVLATKTADVAGEIVQGKIIDFVLRPIDFFRFQVARDLADKIMNFSLQIVEITGLIFVLQPQLYIQTDPMAYLWLSIFLIYGVIISFFINLSVSFLGFWTPEVWAPRFVMFMLVLVFSGGYFPLDIVPKGLYYALFLTPFPYLYFLPTRAYLGLPFDEGVIFVFTGALWVLLSYALARHMWNKGLHSFSFFGR